MEEVNLMKHYVNTWRKRIKQSTTEVQGSQFAAKLINENKEVTVDKNRDQNKPTLVLSVIGDSNTLVPNQWPKHVFQKALIETAKSEKETWILFRGCNGGVSNVVKEAYEDYDSMDAYEDYDSMDCWINGEKESESDRKRRIKLINTTNKEGENLLLNAEMPFQNMKDDPSFLRFETFVSQQNISYFGPDMVFEIPVPTAIIVCEGDIQTISHISEALEKQLPVIIMKGSGKAADLILDYLNKCKENVIQEKFRLLFGYKFDEEEYKKMKKHLKCIKQNKELVGVFDLYNDHPLKLSGIVGEAVVRILSMKIEQIHLADVTQLEMKAYLMNPRFCTPTSLPFYFSLGYTALQENEEFMKKCGKVLLLEALKANRCEYVSSLMDQGVDIKSIDLLDLYKWQSTKEHQLVMLFFGMHLERIIDDAEKRNIPFVVAVRNACRKFLKYKDFDSEEENSDIGIGDVLLWAIVFNRRELAEICWQRGKDHLFTGLICSAILKTLSWEVRYIKEDVLADALEEHSKIFEQRCTNILDKMNDENTEQANSLLHERASVWGIYSSPLIFAYENLIYDLVAHTCVKKYVQKYYNDREDKFLGRLISPEMRFLFTFQTYFIGLIIYSMFVLTSTGTEYFVEGGNQNFEYIVYIWRFGEILEESWGCLRYTWYKGCSRLHWSSRMYNYLTLWNVLDWLSHFTLVLALFLRYVSHSEGQIYARNMYAISLLFIYLRFLEIFLFRQDVGTTVIMIKEMLKDFSQFVYITLFVVLGVGIYYHANLWPDHQTMWSGRLSDWRIWTILLHPYWQIFGEVDLEYLAGSNQDNCSNNRSVWEADPSTERCPQQDLTVQVIAGLYMMFTNILFVNLIIAKFSNTFERIQTDSGKIWYFHLYTVVIDYADWVPSPFNLIYHPLNFICNRFRTIKVADSVEITKIKEYKQTLQRTVAVRKHVKATTKASTVDSQLNTSN